MKQKAFQTEPGQYPLRGLVARRLFGKFSDTEQQAVGKQIFTGPDGISFSMHKVTPDSKRHLALAMLMRRRSLSSKWPLSSREALQNGSIA